MLFLLAITGSLADLGAKSPAGDKLMVEGQRRESRKEWDAAYELYSKALAEDPSEIVYMIAVSRTRFRAAQEHLQAGIRLRSEGRLEDAVAEFENAKRIAGGTGGAEQELAVTRSMISRNARPEDRGLTPIEQMRKERDDRLNRLSGPPTLEPPTRTPVTLKMANQSSRILFETIAKYVGIGILFDPEYQPIRNITYEAKDATVEEALDNLALLTKSYWKPISGNTIFVTNDNPNKRRDYEEHVTRVFYLSSVNSPQEVQEIINVVRSVADLQKVFPYSTQYAIVARGEADKIALAEKVIKDLDKPRSEVIVDILVLEASKVFSRQVTAAIASTGLNVPVTFSPRSSIQTSTTSTSSSSSSSSSSSTTSSTSSTSTSTIPLSSLGHLASSDFSITLPGALLQAALSDANTKILQAPQLRAVDSIKSTLKVGDRQPTASGSYQAGTTTTVNALVNTQFTYIDVGVNVELLSRVHDNGEITMHLELEISNVNGYVNMGGIEEPIIGQRKVVHDIRMREGEVNLIAGLTNRQETNTVTGIPGLSAIPVLRRLFSGESVTRNRSDIMIAVVPHIIRRPDLTMDSLRGVDTGTSANVKLNYSAPETHK
jgi:general secretion pathway protein D